MELTYSTNGNILLLNKELVMSDFTSESRQLFLCKQGCYIYYKDTEKLYKVTMECYFKTLIKLQALIEEYEDRELKLKQQIN